MIPGTKFSRSSETEPATSRVAGRISASNQSAQTPHLGRQ